MLRQGNRRINLLATKKIRVKTLQQEKTNSFVYFCEDGFVFVFFRLLIWA